MNNIPNSNEAPVIGDDVHQPFARRSIMAFVWFIAAIFALGGLVSWYFLDKADEAKLTMAEDGSYIAANDSGKGFLYELFYGMFNGIDDALDDSTAQFNLNTGNASGGPGGLREYARIETLADNVPMEEDDLPTVIGADVKDKNNHDIGEIEDVLIDPDTGVAEALIVDNDDAPANDLSSVSFNYVISQEYDGDALLSVQEEAVESVANFNYSKHNLENGVSLKYLHYGQVLDFEGRIVGQIKKIQYENGRAENVHFVIAPHLSGQESQIYTLPFSQFYSVENPDGYDLVLNKYQTQALAVQLLY